jgi:hypothetical protein
MSLTLTGGEREVFPSVLKDGGEFFKQLKQTTTLKGQGSNYIDIKP